MNTPRMIRLAILPLTLALLCWSTQAFAGAPIRQAGNFGLGVGGGTGTVGLSMKYFQSSQSAFQFTVGFRNGERWCGYYDDDRRRCRDYNGNDHIGLSADYLFEISEFVQTEVIHIGPSIGAGLGLGIWDDRVDVAVSGVLGLEFMLNPIPIDFVVEWRPTLNFIPYRARNFVNFTGHARFYF